MNKRKILRIFSIVSLVATLALHQVNQEHFHIPYSVIPDTIAALFDPSIPKIFLPPFYCAGYALTAAEIKGVGGYNFGNAWDLPSKNQVLWRGTAKSLKELNMKPPIGSIIGFYNPNSIYNQHGRDFTHVALYIGNGYIAHQYGPFVLKSDLDEFLKSTGLEMRVVITPPKEKTNNQITYRSMLPGFYDVNYR